MADPVELVNHPSPRVPGIGIALSANPILGSLRYRLDKTCLAPQRKDTGIRSELRATRIPATRVEGLNAGPTNTNQQ